MVTTNTTDMQATFQRLSQAALTSETGGDGGTFSVLRDDLSSLLLAYRLELGNQNKELPEPEAEPTSPSQDDSDNQQWKTEFGASYFNDVSPELVQSLSLLTDQSWHNDELPSFVLCEQEINNTRYSLRAWVGFDEEDDNKEVFVFSLGLNVNDEYDWTHTSAIESIFDTIDPMCRLDSDETQTNNLNIIELINRTQKEFPAEVIAYIKSKS
ncbi:hypothetical protein AB6D66_01360 [Vibrio pomeroyi]|uniref:Uncharacterized protein n=1 Tax=Vibrio pomeroyi TaxID=198832 RepID=A0ABV4MRD8_9VIBR